MAVSGINYGSVFQGLFGTTSPVSGSAPTDVTTPDGQNLKGLTAIQPVVSSAVATTLSGAGTLQAYLLDTGVSLDAGHSDRYIKGTAASATSTTVVLAESALTQGFLVGMTVTGLASGLTGVITSIGGSGNKTITASGGITGYASVVVGEVIVGLDPPRWVRFPDADYTVTGTTRDQAFLPFSLLTPRSGYMLWIPNSVTFSAGSGGITVTQLGQSAKQLHDDGYWGG